MSLLQLHWYKVCFLSFFSLQGILLFIEREFFALLFQCISAGFPWFIFMFFHDFVCLRSVQGMDSCTEEKPSEVVGVSEEIYNTPPVYSADPCYHPNMIPIDISVRVSSLSSAELKALSREEEKLNNAAASIKGCSS